MIVVQRLHALCLVMNYDFSLVIILPLRWRCVTSLLLLNLCFLRFYFFGILFSSVTSFIMCAFSVCDATDKGRTRQDQIKKIYKSLFWCDKHNNMFVATVCCCHFETVGVLKMSKVNFVLNYAIITVIILLLREYFSNNRKRNKVGFFIGGYLKSMTASE